MTDEIQNGGPEWERNQAAKRIAAGVVAGDEAVIDEGANRLGDAVVNAATSKLIGTLKTVFDASLETHIAPIATQGNAIARVLSAERRKNNKWRHDFQQQLDARLGGFESIQEAILTAVQDGTARLGKIEADIAGLNGRMELSESDRQRLNAEVAEIKALIEARPAQRTQEKEAIIAEILDRLRAERGDG